MRRRGRGELNESSTHGKKKSWKEIWLWRWLDCCANAELLFHRLAAAVVTLSFFLVHLFHSSPFTFLPVLMSLLLFTYCKLLPLDLMSTYLLFFHSSSEKKNVQKFFIAWSYKCRDMTLNQCQRDHLELHSLQMKNICGLQSLLVMKPAGSWEEPDNKLVVWTPNYKSGKHWLKMLCPTIEHGLWWPISLIMNWPGSTEKSGLLITRWQKCCSKGVWCGNGHWAVLLITVLCARDKWCCMQLVTWYIGSVTSNGVLGAIMYSRIDTGWSEETRLKVYMCTICIKLFLIALYQTRFHHFITILTECAASPTSARQCWRYFAARLQGRGSRNSSPTPPSLQGVVLRLHSLAGSCDIIAQL